MAKRKKGVARVKMIERVNKESLNHTQTSLIIRTEMYNTKVEYYKSLSKYWIERLGGDNAKT